MEKLMVTVAEAAQMLGVCRNRVYELIYSGQPASVKMGRSRRISVDDLKRFVAENSVAA
ncbi:hypothetical protein GCM10027030_23770 [Luteococcus sediminum]